MLLVVSRSLSPPNTLSLVPIPGICPIIICQGWEGLPVSWYLTLLLLILWCHNPHFFQATLCPQEIKSSLCPLEIKSSLCPLEIESCLPSLTPG